MNKKKIYTLTCTWAPSYGAVLQAYALASKLNNMSMNATIINYQPNYYGFGSPKRLLAPLYGLKKYLLDRVFLDFLKESELLTKQTYRNINDLRKKPLEADAFVVGSDQVWNSTKYFNGRDDTMFLDFARPGQKRISYAASLAMSEIPHSQSDRYKDMLSKFDSVSVRENSGAELIRSLGISDVETVIDPVYLLNQKEWGGLSSKSQQKFETKKYVLVICLEERDEVYQYARKKADQLNIELYTFKSGLRNTKKHMLIDQQFQDLSVFDYLNIIQNAQFVIADSFHAMSFSLIFNKDFAIIPRKDDGNSRMLDLLADIDLKNRVVTSHDNTLDSPIDYNIVNSKLSKKVAHAENFLANSIDS